MIQLRPYQEEAVTAILDNLFADSSTDKTPGLCVSLPTGAGKTIVFSELVRRLRAESSRPPTVLLLAHVQELVSQAAKTFNSLLPEVPVGIVSAGLGQRRSDTDITVASIQTAARCPEKILTPDLVIVDEAHRIPQQGEGQYRSLLNYYASLKPHLAVVGLTATPFRMDGGDICRPGHFLEKLVYEADLYDLIKQGYLSPLLSATGGHTPDLSALRTRQGEFTDASVDEAFLPVIREIVADALSKTTARKATVWFTSTVKMAECVAALLPADSVGFVHAKTKAEDRRELVDRFKAGDLKHLVNCAVFTEGFDAPHVDALVLIRPTQSPGLFVQMVGRGLRLAEGKKDCLVLDYGQNIERHGPVNLIRGWKPKPKAERKASILKPDDYHGGKPWKCQECAVWNEPEDRACIACGWSKPAPLPKVERFAGKGAVIVPTEGGLAKNSGHPVTRITVHQGESTNTGYRYVKLVLHSGLMITGAEYLSVENPRGRPPAEKLWRSLWASALPLPATVEEAAAALTEGNQKGSFQGHVFNRPDRIWVGEKLGRHFKVVGMTFRKQEASA